MQQTMSDALSLSGIQCYGELFQISVPRKSERNVRAVFNRPIRRADADAIAALVRASYGRKVGSFSRNASVANAF